MNARRIMFIFIAFSVSFLMLLLRVFYIQAFEGKKLASRANAQRIYSTTLYKARGDIVDRNGIKFTNRTKMTLAVVRPLDLAAKPEEIEIVANILGRNDVEMFKREIEVNKRAIVIGVDEEKEKIIKQLELSSVTLLYTFKRYDDESIAKHVTGYLRKADSKGAYGVEKYFDKELETDKTIEAEIITDARNNIFKGFGYKITRMGFEKNTHFNVKLTLDYHIQYIVEKVMEEMQVTGAVAVVDTTSGNVLALASKPDYKHEKIEMYLSSTSKELFNRATASYSPGSIFKIIDAAVLIENGLDIDEKVFCEGGITVGDRYFRCSSYLSGGHGEVDIKKAFAQSCNTFFIDRAIKTGAQPLLEMAARLGLGQKTNLSDQGIVESPGNIPNKSKYFSKGDIANISIGQGDILATPVQIAAIISAIANDGIMHQLNIVDSIVDEEGNIIRNMRSREFKRVFEKETAKKLKELMYGVTNEGTGIAARLDELGGAAGKTGSAQTGKDGIVHAWFAGFFPYNAPRYAMCVFVENGQYGGKTAAPVFAEIAQKMHSAGF